MIEDEAHKLFNKYVKVGRGHLGGLVAASRDLVALSTMLARSYKFVKLLVVLLDGVEGESSSEVRGKAQKWLADYAVTAGEESEK